MGASGTAVLIAAGGTGGHVFPALALAASLRDRGRTAALATDARGDAQQRLRANLDPGLGVHTVRAGRLGRGPLQALAGAVDLAAGLLEARRLLRRLRPAVAVGFGGYPSVPPMLAAMWAGVPTVIHEQNALLGRANRLLARRARLIALSFEPTERLRPSDRARTRLVGNPVRRDVIADADGPYKAPAGAEPVHLLVLGGSQGASVFATLLPDAIGVLPVAMQQRFNVAQQCRAEDLERARGAYAQTAASIELATFFDDVPRRLKTAHLVISRAGASSVAELTAAGRPAVLVPYPHAADDHQTANAHAVAATGAGWVEPQAALTPERLAACLSDLLRRPTALAQAAAAASAAAHPNAAEALADLVETLLPIPEAAA